MLSKESEKNTACAFLGSQMSEEWCDVLFWATMMSNKVKSADEEDDHPGSSQRVF